MQTWRSEGTSNQGRDVFPSAPARERGQNSGDVYTLAGGECVMRGFVNSGGGGEIARDIGREYCTTRPCAPPTPLRSEKADVNNLICTRGKGA